MAKQVLTYSQFLELVANTYNKLDSGWYSVTGLAVLPPERKAVSVETILSKCEQLGYWFIPAPVAAKSHTLEVWLGNVRWKSLRGYGIDCVVWCKPVERSSSAGIKNITYGDLT